MAQYNCFGYVPHTNQYVYLEISRKNWCENEIATCESEITQCKNKNWWTPDAKTRLLLCEIHPMSQPKPVIFVP
jgi:hypothetical protein